MTLRLTITRINYSKGGIILISSITKSPLMVITLNTRRVKAVHRLDSNPNKPANSREIYRLAVDRPLIHVVLVPNLLVFTIFYARHRRIEEEEEERKGFVTYEYMSGFTASWRMLSRRYLWNNASTRPGRRPCTIDSI